jgi:hypothetical protein
VSECVCVFAQPPSTTVQLQEACERVRAEQQQVQLATTRLKALCEQLRHQNQQIVVRARVCMCVSVRMCA